jgi:hypothetical protein
MIDHRNTIATCMIDHRNTIATCMIDHRNTIVTCMIDHRSAIVTCVIDHRNTIVTCMIDRSSINNWHKHDHLNCIRVHLRTGESRILKTVSITHVAIVFL